MARRFINNIPKSISKVHKGVIPVRGEGSYVFTESGNKYLDYTSGIGALSLGHCHPRVVSGVQKQVKQLIHAPQQVFGSHPPQLTLNKKLLDIMPCDKLESIFYTNSGSESTDNAIKAARRYTGKTNVISFLGGFHGRTLGAMSVSSSNTKTKQNSQPLMSGVFFCEPNIEQFDRLINLNSCLEETAAVIFEPVQGEGGINSLSIEFLKYVEQICKTENVVFIVDEVQCGFGRTGTWWNASQKQIEPDILTFGKGIGTGFPIAGLTMTKEISDSLNVGYLGGTYGGNPLVTEAASITIDVFKDEQILENVKMVGLYLNKELNRLKESSQLISGIRQYGLMVAIEFHNKYNHISSKKTTVNKVLEMLRDDHNVLVLFAGYKNQFIRLLPPLNTTPKEIKYFVDSLEEVLNKLSNH